MAIRARTAPQAIQSEGPESSPTEGLRHAVLGTVAGHPIVATFDEHALRGIVFDPPPPDLVEPPPWLLDPFARYLAGEPEDFATVPIAYDGTPFRRKVWAELRRIPWGKVASYGEIAERIRVPRGTRAVGAANGANPIAIVVPCHRVVEGSGLLGGFSGGLDVKRALLAREGARFVGDRVHVGQLSLFGSAD